MRSTLGRHKQLIMMIGVPLGGIAYPFEEGGAGAKPHVSGTSQGRFTVINLPHPRDVPRETPSSASREET